MWAIFRQFFLLGLVSFGGPAAHIGYFKQRFVDELNWLDEQRYGSLVALSQVIPGPSSSQVGFAVGYHRGGLGGAVAAFFGFTLPSFMLMYLLAVSSTNALQQSWFLGLIHGLKLLAVVVVFDAVLSMARQFCRQWLTRVLMLFAATLSLFFLSLWSQIFILLAAALVGRTFLTAQTEESLPSGGFSSRFSFGWLGLFALLFLLSLFWLTSQTELLRIFAQFFHTGALVFGGGHVVLPLLEISVGQSLGSERFLTGYAMAQAVPGPMFSLAAFLGAELPSQSPLLGALIATLGIFLPGFLLLLGVIKGWQSLMYHGHFRGVINGINAAVVGLLLAALISPVFSSAVGSLVDLVLVLAGFIMLKQLKLSILWVLLFFACAGMALMAF
ncbi:chromate efflux transporter [Shewanella sp. AS1]|uniref:chromate efflux transporter n=1 Tax=Shewanella sp. AS1 TaxID=2907626 RepID=UPI001F32819E|nr:chromate efflux transporter [Shewanella sp. AS1]MCE9677755.1 chromate efflux transporter [Shewanella sp. AS1]